MRMDPLANSLPELGVGIIYSTGLEPLICENRELVQVVEIEPQSLWLKNGDSFEDRSQVLDHLIELPGAKLIHSVGVPVGGTKCPDPSEVLLLAEWTKALHSPWFSEHLSFNSTEDFSTGFLLPPCQTKDGVETAVRNIGILRKG